MSFSHEITEQHSKVDVLKKTLQTIHYSPIKIKHLKLKHSTVSIVVQPIHFKRLASCLLPIYLDLTLLHEAKK